MTKQFEAVYEQGRLRPLEPLELPEGSRIRVLVLAPEAAAEPAAPAEALAEIARLPLEGAADDFSGAEHDAVLYPRK